MAQLCSLTAMATEIETGGIRYDIDPKAQSAAVIAKGFGEKYAGDIVIPASIFFGNLKYDVTAIEKQAFYNCRELTSVVIPGSVKEIGTYAFCYCSGLTSIVIPNGVESIELGAFWGCSNVTHVIIGNNVTSFGPSTFAYCAALTSVTFGRSVKNISDGMFWGTGLVRMTIPEGVTSIGGSAFYGCLDLKLVSIPNSMTSIGASAFYGCRNLANVTIPSGMESIGDRAFLGCNLESVTSLIEEPFHLKGKDDSYSPFAASTFANATLYVPAGTVDKYKTTVGWENFEFIEEMKDEPLEKVCAKPTIHYQDNHLTFTCATPGAVCKGRISDDDIQTFEGNDIKLSVKYTIIAYATCEGYVNSEMVTATLCWIDATPLTEGITDDEDAVAEIRAVPVLIQSEAGAVTVDGATVGTPISVYDLSGRLLGSTTAANGMTKVAVAATMEKIVVVRVGNRSVKIVK